jgi:hypothetical protein
MPWRGPVEDGEFPTLGYAVADWIEDNCAIPDGDLTGQPFILTDEQIKFLLRFYRIDPDVSPGDHPTSVFKYRRAQLVRPQKWGKGPLSAAIVCAEAAGPVLFDGWDANGEPVGRPWATPWIQLVAVSEDQTDNVMNALIPMIELGALKAEIPDVGRTRINVVADGGFGRIEPVTSAAISRLGQRLTFAVHDETHSWNSHNGGVKLADTQRRNLAGMGGRSIETTNAWNPAEQSVAQMTYESELDDVLIDFPETPKASIRNKAQRRKALKTAYGDSWWIDLDRIESEIEELLPRDPNQAERFFLNRIVSASDRAFDIDQWNRLAAPQEIEPGRLITLGFDGARREDSTALVATDVERGYQWVIGIWEKPKDDADPDWEVSEPEIQEAVAYAFETWDVWRLYADPPYFESQIDAWAGTYGEQRVIRWWTNRQKAMAYALRAWITDWRDGVLTHDGNEVLTNHIGNSVRHRTRMRDDAGGWLWTIRKDAAKSPRKIDGAMAACLSWEARGDAIADGVLNRQTYTTASW